MQWYIGVLKKYVVFSGRASRKEYWTFFVISLVVTIVLGILDGVIGTKSPDAAMGTLGGLYSLAVFLPSLAVLVRRLHDISKSGWWVLIGIIPFLGWIVLLIFAALGGTPGSNQFGPAPASAGGLATA